MTPPLSRRRGFTLVEILAVIAIIGILMAMSFGLYGYVNTAKKEARARGEIAALNAKLEEFKARYGDYPMASSGSETDWETTLFNALTGRWYYTTVNGVLQWDKHLASGGDNLLRPFIAEGVVGTDLSVPSSTKPVTVATKFVDPWGNAYRYRYGVLNTGTGKPNVVWDTPGVLLISAGAKFTAGVAESDGATLPSTDFFAGNEDTTGIIPTTYFDDQYRADNLTNFGNR